MGLCKCHNRKVTNLFCFVHRVNVCEDCMVVDHPRCVVRSYLKWLEDSDYDSVCVLCAQSLLDGPVIRLSCYDLFHEDCLRNHVAQNSGLNSNCPKCKEVICPPSHFDSPVTLQLRKSLVRLGLFQQVSIETQSAVDSQASSNVLWSSQSYSIAEWSAGSSVPQHSCEDKYHRKPWTRVLWRWLQMEQSSMIIERGMYRLIFGVGLMVIFAVIAIILLTRVGRAVARTDTSLDWNFNPQLRTGD